jgi:hypothetical protein
MGDLFGFFLIRVTGDKVGDMDRRRFFALVVLAILFAIGPDLISHLLPGHLREHHSPETERGISRSE